MENLQTSSFFAPNHRFTFRTSIWILGYIDSVGVGCVTDVLQMWNGCETDAHLFFQWKCIRFPAYVRNSHLFTHISRNVLGCATDAHLILRAKFSHLSHIRRTSRHIQSHFAYVENTCTSATHPSHINAHFALMRTNKCASVAHLPQIRHTSVTHPKIDFFIDSLSAHQSHICDTSITHPPHIHTSKSAIF